MTALIHSKKPIGRPFLVTTSFIGANCEIEVRISINWESQICSLTASETDQELSDPLGAELYISVEDSGAIELYDARADEAMDVTADWPYALKRALGEALNWNPLSFEPVSGVIRGAIENWTGKVLADRWRLLCSKEDRA